jgi:hypothetical protein
MEAVVAIEAVVIVLLAVLVAGLLRSHAEILRALHRLGAGEDQAATVELTASPRRVQDFGPPPLAAISGPNPRGGATAVSLRDSRGHTLLAFLSTTCSSCQPFWNELAAGAELPAGVRPVVVTKSPGEESPSEIARLSPPGVMTVMSSEAWDAFRVPATPYFVLVDAARGWVAGEGSAASWKRLGQMVTTALGDGAHPLNLSTAGRAADVDEELYAAGITPGDPRLFQRPEEDDPA